MRDGTSHLRLRVEKGLHLEGRNKDDKEPTQVEINEVVITGKAKVISLNREYLLNALRFGFDEVAILDELSTHGHQQSRPRRWSSCR